MSLRALRFFALLATALLGGVVALSAADAARVISLVTDSAPERAARHGQQKLRAALEAHGWTVEETTSLEMAQGRQRIVLGTVASGSIAAKVLRDARVEAPPTAAEGLMVRRLTLAGRLTIVLCGADVRGLMYATLDVADRVGWAANASSPLSEIRDIVEQPAVRDRSLSVYAMNRAHWESRFYDERYWARYFDTLAASRFNRCLIVLGDETGGFLAPAYPYFFDTPGFDGVRMVGLTREQQARNLAALNRLIELAHDRGIAVSLGLWDHIYRGGGQTGGPEWLEEYVDKPVPNSVEGVTSSNLRAYTLAALKELHARVPALDALQFRLHEESGLRREEVAAFSREVFQQVRGQKPGLLVEVSGQGAPDELLAAAREPGANLRVTTPYWLEQIGLPYHPTHLNPTDQRERRQGYADFLRQPSRTPLSWRLGTGGTARVLLWGDPEYVRRYSASTALFDQPSWEVQEPLATKMAAQRPEMPTFALMPEKYRTYDYEFERYWHFFQMWGRVGYNPGVSTETWQREFRRRFGSAGAHVEAGLQRASQVLPMIVAAVYPHQLGPATRGWPERQSLGINLQDYAQNTGTDPEQFESFAEAARRILDNGTTAKRTPEATSRWFNTTADAILASVRAAESSVGRQRSKEFDATITDLKILAQLARFHSRRIISAVHFNLFKKSLRIAELVAATYQEKEVVAAWRELVAIADDRYSFDLAMGARNLHLAGHWRDELKKLEVNLRELEDQCCPPDPELLKEKIWKPATTGDLIAPRIEHERLRTARPGQPLRITVRAADPGGIQSVRLRYRPVTQFEDYATLEMQPTARRGEYAATVPGDAISPDWDFMYFIEAIDRAGNGTIWPDLAKEAPYVVVKIARE